MKLESGRIFWRNIEACISIVFMLVDYGIVAGVNIFVDVDLLLCKDEDSYEEM